jgi:membrane protein
LIIVIAVGDYLFGQPVVKLHILNQMSELIGRDGAQGIGNLIDRPTQAGAGTWGPMLGILSLLFGATGALAELQDGLNRIWKVPDRPIGIKHLVSQRLASLALIMCVAFLLLVSLVISAAVAALGTLLRDWMPMHEMVGHGMVFLDFLGSHHASFAMIYKVLPDTRIRWREVWIAPPARLFFLFWVNFWWCLYIGKSAIASTYGAAGSWWWLLIWIYYIRDDPLYGAEFTKAYADPRAHAPANPML